MQHLWGIDFGGTKLEGIVLERHGSQKPIARVRIPTEAKSGYAHILSRLEELLGALKQKSGLSPDRIGIGHPGSIDRQTGILRNSNTTALNGKPFKRDLEACFNVPVCAANDANCFALAEARLGAGKGYSSVFGVNLGTGVGGGIFLNGSVLSGPNDLAGEWGHNPLDEVNGPECYCGRKGCVETIISGPALEQFYFERTGTRRIVTDIASRAASDSAARETIERLHYYFGKAVAVVVNIIDPDCIVMGGGLSKIESLYTEALPSLKKYAFHESYTPRILPNALGDSAGVFGAALLSTLGDNGQEDFN